MSNADRFLALTEAITGYGWGWRSEWLSRPGEVPGRARFTLTQEGAADIVAEGATPLEAAREATRRAGMELTEPPPLPPASSTEAVRATHRALEAATARRRNAEQAEQEAFERFEVARQVWEAEAFPEAAALRHRQNEVIEAAARAQAALARVLGARPPDDPRLPF